MNDNDFKRLCSLGADARTGLLQSMNIRELGERAEAAANALHTLKQQNVAALANVDSLRAELRVWFGLGVAPDTAQDALRLTRAIASALSVPADNDGAIQEALEGLVKERDDLQLRITKTMALNADAGMVLGWCPGQTIVDVAKRRVEMLTQLQEALAIGPDTKWPRVLELAAERKEKAQRWDAAQAAGALDAEKLHQLYNAGTTADDGRAAIVAHVRAHDAGAAEAQQDATSEECDRQRAEEQRQVLALIGEKSGIPANAHPLNTDTFTHCVRGLLAKIRPKDAPPPAASPPAPAAEGGVRVGDRVSFDDSEGTVSALGGNGAHVVANDFKCWQPLSALKVVKRAPPKPGERWFSEPWLLECEATGDSDDSGPLLHCIEPGIEGTPRPRLLWANGNGWRFLRGPAETASALPAQGKAMPQEVRDWLSKPNWAPNEHQRHRIRTVGNLGDRAIPNTNDIREMADVVEAIALRLWPETALVAEVRAMKKDESKQ